MDTESFLKQNYLAWLAEFTSIMKEYVDNWQHLSSQENVY